MRNMKWLAAGIVVLLVVAGSVACSNDTGPTGEIDNGSDSNTGADEVVSLEVVPEETEAVIVGRVLSTTGGGRTPLGETQVWLATVFYNDDQTEGAYFIDGSASPSTMTGADGSFVFRNLEARDYVIVVGDLYGQNSAIYNPDGNARIFSGILGEVLDVGTLEVDLTTAPVITPLPVDPYPGVIPGDGSAYP